MSQSVTSRITESVSAPQGASRRTILKSATWTVPAVLAAGAVPLASASPLLVDKCDPITVANPDTSLEFVPAGDNLTGSGTLVNTGSVVGTFTVSSDFTTFLEPSPANNVMPSPNVHGIRLNSRPKSGMGTNGRDFDDNYLETMYVTFDQPVTDVSFYIYNVTWEGGYREFVSATAEGLLLTPQPLPSNSLLIEDPTRANWFTPAAQTGANNYGASPVVAVYYQVPGPVQTMAVSMIRTANSLDAGGVTLGFDAITPNQALCMVPA